MENMSLEYYADRYIDGTITTEEWKVLQMMMEYTENQRYMAELMDTQLQDTAILPDEFPGVTSQILTNLEGKIKEQEMPRISPGVKPMFVRRWWAAASIVLIVGVGAYLFITKKENAQPAQVVSTDLPAGKDGAVLTLADGTQLVLDSLKNGLVAMQNGAGVSLKDGKLAYDATGKESDETSFNIMTTPRGRQFEIRLPDGTLVWLNAASSIRYPTAFTGRERKVELQGEAYFEVTKNANQPFIVNARNKAEIEVLGTDFNISAYQNDKSLNTTLIDGSVKVNGVQISPGQQARVTDIVNVTSGADIDKVMAWKRGLFSFEGTPLNEVMNQLERWYDIEVVYEKESPALRFGGELSRSMSLKGVLNALEQSGIHLRLEGRKLTVLPK